MQEQAITVLGHSGYEVGSLMLEKHGFLPQDIVMND